ncbi:MAG: hypothetical protein U0625_06800 [Phycisphaerales bacterium]
MRFLKRLTIRLRWPAVVVAAALLAVIALSCRYSWFGRLQWGNSTWSLGVNATVVGGRWNADVYRDNLEYFQWLGRADWSAWSMGTYFVAKAYEDVLAGAWFAMCPIWWLALPPALLAVAGFRLKRREQTPGQCKRCGHPLAGAVVCPECGTPAPASAA